MPKKNKDGNVIQLAPPAAPKYPTIPDPYFRDTCSVCGVTSALPTEFTLSRIDCKRDIYCPNGHTGTMSKRYVEEMIDKIKIPWENFVKENCGACGIHFQLEKGLQEHLKKSGKKFFCPNGCKVNYTPPPPPGPPPKTEADIDYEKLINFHNALGQIAGLEPKAFKNKKLLRTAILIAKNALALEKIRDENK